MSKTEFIVLLAANSLVVAGYVLWNLLLRRGKTRKGKGQRDTEREEKPQGYNNKGYVIKALVMFLCPVVGACYFFFSFVLYKMFFYKDVDLEDVIFSKERVKSYMKADEDRERNMVPLEEAILVTDKDNLREYMMNVVKGDVQKSLSSILLALNSSDTETSHYAASVLQEILNNFRATVQKNIYEITNGTDDEEKCVRCGIMIDYMNEVLKQNVFSDMEQKMFVAEMDNICECLYSVDPARMTALWLEAVSMRCLDAHEYEKCEKWCGRSAALYPNTLSSYTCSLKYYFSRGDRERFFKTLEELKRSEVVIDKETLELIRVFT